MKIINSLTRTFDSVITSLFGGRNIPTIGDSRTPFDEDITDNRYVKYNERYGWHLKNDDYPQKSVGEKPLKSKGV